MAEYNLTIKDERPHLSISAVGPQGAMGPQGPVGPQGPAGVAPTIPANAGLFKGAFRQPGYVDFLYEPENVVMRQGTMNAQGRFVPDEFGNLTVDIQVQYHTLLEVDYYLDVEGTGPLDRLQLLGAHPQYINEGRMLDSEAHVYQNSAQTRWFGTFEYTVLDPEYPYLRLQQVGSNTTVFDLYGYAYIPPYNKNQVVTYNNSLWGSTKQYNNSVPGDNADWELLVKGEAIHMDPA